MIVCVFARENESCVTLFTFKCNCIVMQFVSSLEVKSWKQMYFCCCHKYTVHAGCVFLPPNTAEHAKPNLIHVVNEKKINA